MPILKPKSLLGLIIAVCLLPITFFFISLGAKSDNQFLFWLLGLFCISMFGKLIIWLTSPKPYKPYHMMTKKEKEDYEKNVMEKYYEEMRKKSKNK